MQNLKFKMDNGEQRVSYGDIESMLKVDYLTFTQKIEQKGIV